MSAPACHLIAVHIYKLIRRPRRPEGWRLWAIATLLAALLVPAPSARAQEPISPSTISFGNQPLNQPSAGMGATFRNSLKAPFAVRSIRISGDAAADFAARGDCPQSPRTLEAGKSCTITVTFTPSMAGLRTAMLTIRDDSPASPRTFSLVGTGVASIDLAAAGGVVEDASANGTASNQQNTENTSGATVSDRELAPRPARPGVSAGSGLLPATLAPVSSSGSAIGLVSIVVSPANSFISAGGTQQFTATGIYSDGTSVNLTSSVGWGSSSPTIGTINGAGLATGVVAGSTVITASYASVSSPPVAEAGSVTVSAPPIVVSSPGVLSGSTTLTVTGPAVGFSNTGSLNTSRMSATATLLNNGMVLIAGGFNTTPLASAELYNPGTGTFTATGSLNFARFAFTATLLNNDMVLMAGGEDANTAVDSAELYNPVTGSFSLTGNLNVARYYHTATLLNNGLVLITGGLALTTKSLPARSFTIPPPALSRSLEA